jgi:hypothetical protein
MKIFLNSDGKFWAFKEDGSQDHLITADMVPSTAEACEAANAPPPPPTPTVVDMAQARLALLEGDKLTLVNQAIAAMTGVEGDRARIEWEFRQTVRRDSELVQMLVAGFGWTQQEVDDLFTLAATK